MSFSFSVCCFGRVERDAALTFLQHVDWESLATEHHTWHGTDLVSGRQLLYAPGYRREYLLGFNAPTPNSLALAACAWVASRSQALSRHEAIVFCDAKPMSVVVEGRAPGLRDSHEGLPADSQGILTFGHESMLERGLAVLEHKRIRQVLRDLSTAWPLGEPPPTPRQGLNRIRRGP